MNYTAINLYTHRDGIVGMQRRVYLVDISQARKLKEALDTVMNVVLWIS